MIKKYLIAVMVLVVALALVACGGTGTDTTADQGTEPPVTEHVHNYVEETIPATCTATGKIITKCECGDVQSETEIPLTDHTASALDCEKDTVCTVCNTVLAEKTGHIISASEVVTAATCGTAGKEKGACAVCGKIVETEIPATGHVASGTITIADGKFKTTCSICSQAVTLTAQTPAFKLDFESDVATQSANDIGLSVYKPGEWTIAEANGSNVFTLGDGKPYYINIDDPAKLSALGTFVISFDYTTTKEAAAGSAASVISILTDAYNGKTDTSKTGWGWMLKLVEDADKLATVNKVDALTAANSIAVERNVKYNVQIVISPANKATHTFINGTYIGTSNQVKMPVGEIPAASASIRFGDGPVCGHVIDNFAISALK